MDVRLIQNARRVHTIQRRTCTLEHPPLGALDVALDEVGVRQLFRRDDVIEAPNLAPQRLDIPDSAFGPVRQAGHRFITLWNEQRHFSVAIAHSKSVQRNRAAGYGRHILEGLVTAWIWFEDMHGPIRLYELRQERRVHAEVGADVEGYIPRPHDVAHDALLVVFPWCVRPGRTS